MTTAPTTATIIREGDWLSIGWSFGPCGDVSGDYSADEEGLAALKADLKADAWAAAQDFEAIDCLEIPPEDGRGDSVELHGDSE
jgi:hypothetical protein